MAKIALYTTTGKSTTTVTASDKIFAAKINKGLMAQAAKVFLANQRKASGKTKSRGEIAVTKAKVWRQKGTGKARHGSRNAPIFVGGAKAHGPTGTQNYRLTMPKKMKRLSLFSALTQKLKDKNIIVLDGLDKLNPKTKAHDAVLRKVIKDPKKLLLLLDPTQKSIKRFTNNLPFLENLTVTRITTYQALKAQTIIFTKESLKTLETHYLK